MTQQTRYRLDDDGNIVFAEPPSWWDKHWLKVCLALLFIFTAAGFYKAEHERIDREDSVNRVLAAGCYRNNNLRSGLREYFTIQITQTEKNAENPALTGQYPKKLVEELVNKEIQRLEVDVHSRFAPIKCTLAVPGDLPSEKEVGTQTKQGSSE